MKWAIRRLYKRRQRGPIPLLAVHMLAFNQTKRVQPILATRRGILADRLIAGANPVRQRL